MQQLYGYDRIRWKQTAVAWNKEQEVNGLGTLLDKGINLKKDFKMVKM